MIKIAFDVKIDKNPVIFFIKQDMLKIAMLRLHAIDIWLNKQHFWNTHE